MSQMEVAAAALAIGGAVRHRVAGRRCCSARSGRRARAAATVAGRPIGCPAGVAMTAIVVAVAVLARGLALAAPASCISRGLA
jgi:hypothetical protein